MKTQAEQIVFAERNMQLVQEMGRLIENHKSDNDPQNLTHHLSLLKKNLEQQRKLLENYRNE